MLAIGAKPSSEREGASLDGRVQSWWRFLPVAARNGRSENVQQETDFLNRTVTVSGTTYIESQEVMVEALRALGSEVKYTESEGVGHNSWDNVVIRATLG